MQLWEKLNLAVRSPLEHQQMAYLIGVTMLATATGGYVGGRYTWRRHEEILTASGTLAHVSPLPSGAWLRASTAMAGAAASLFTALSFCANVLSIEELFENADARARPYALLTLALFASMCLLSLLFTTGLVIFALACPSNCLPGHQHDGVLIDREALRSALPIWSLVLVLSSLADPGAAKLLPWAKPLQTSHDGFPTFTSKWVAILLPAALGGGLAAIELHYVLTIGITLDSVLFVSLGFNALLFAREQIERALHVALRCVRRAAGGGRRSRDLKTFNVAEWSVPQELERSHGSTAVDGSSALGQSNFEANPVLLAKMERQKRREKAAQQQAHRSAEGGASAPSNPLKTLGWRLSVSAPDESEAQVRAYDKVVHWATGKTAYARSPVDESREYEARLTATTKAKTAAQARVQADAELNRRALKVARGELPNRRAQILSREMGQSGCVGTSAGASTSTMEVTPVDARLVKVKRPQAPPATEVGGCSSLIPRAEKKLISSYI